MVGGPFHQPPRRRHERLDDFQPLGDRQGVAVAAARGENHPYPGGPHPINRAAGGHRHLMLTVSHRAIDVENDEPNSAGGRCSVHSTYGTPAGMSDAAAPNKQPAFTAVARVGEIPVGEGRTYEVGGRLVAVLFDGTTYHAIDDLCPHMGASLAAGPFVDGIVTCPWHAWRFRACDGAWCDNEKLRVEVFPVRVIDGEIEVAVNQV